MSNSPSSEATKAVFRRNTKEVQGRAASAQREIWNRTSTKRREETTMLSSLVPYQRAESRDASTWYMGSLVTFLAESRDTGGSFTLLEATMKPGNEPPPHVHEREDELFYVLDGAFDVFVGDDAFQLRAGGCVFMPRLRPHGFIIRSARFRMLALFQPGGIDGYFRSMSDSPAAELDLPSGAITYATADMEPVVQDFADYGVRILSPDQITQQMPSYAAAIQKRADLGLSRQANS
jgi:mannose-6-phosphate isomerase-like protein (cupin superfamily)